MPEKTSALGQNERDKPAEPKIPRTWRRDVYTALANINLGFEQVTATLKTPQEVEILEDSTEADMLLDLDNIWTAINHVILSELNASETANYRTNSEDSRTRANVPEEDMHRV